MAAVEDTTIKTNESKEKESLNVVEQRIVKQLEVQLQLV